ncbi:MAG: F0F1 ATP synthase subunit B [Clostridia bacterium]|nr:F0F1 ATP synthase subunit B [Clostridia bacterium]
MFNLLIANVLLLEAEVQEESTLFSADQVGGYASTALFTIINLLIFFIVYKLFVHKKLIGFIEKRQGIIAGSLDEAKKIEEEAKINFDKSNQSIDEARVTAQQIIDDARSSSNEEAELVIKKAKEEANAILERAEVEAKRMKKVALEEMKDEISDLAVIISEKVIGDVVSAETLKELSMKRTAEVLEAEVKSVE